MLHQAAGVPQNPPVPPAGWAFMPQAQVTPAMTQRAVQILDNPTAFPGPSNVTDPSLFYHGVETIDGVACMFYVLWHPPDPPVGPNAWHRGVSILVPTTKPQGVFVEGIDCSSYQGHPDWKAVATSKKFAFIRVSDGIAVHDSSFAYNWNGARANGILRGAYQLFRPTVDPKKQASLLFEATQSNEGELPPVLDLEAVDGASTSLIIANVRMWLSEVGDAFNVKPLLYTSPSYFTRFSDDDAASIAALCELWVANWNVAAPSSVKGFTAARFWQYSVHGVVPGINGAAMDLDRFYGDLSALLTYAKKTSPLPASRDFAFDLATVAGAQAALNALGYQPPLVVDGIQGPLTNAAIAAFKNASANGPLK